MFINTRRLSFAALMLWVGITAVGCSSDSAKEPAVDPDMKPFCELPAVCQQIAQACMPKDDASNDAVHDCHMTGMGEGNEADCAGDLDRCLATCNAAPALSSDPPEDLLALCADEGAGTGAPTDFPSKALLSFSNDDGSLAFELRMGPNQPVHVGPDGMGKLTVHDANGAPADGLTIAVSTYMPVMRHSCSPVEVKVTPQGGGEYLLSPLLASMKGACELVLQLSGDHSEKVTTPTFDVTE